MSLRENVWFIIFDQVVHLCLKLDGSYKMQDVRLKHKSIENSEIVKASLALVDSLQWNIRTVFHGGLRLISGI